MTSRVDMHCHSTASQLSRLGVQRSLGLPECATPPQEVYELAKRRGMDFVTITDHDTIDGCLELADRPDCFISEELTARFAGEPQAVHVLCYGITPGDHEWLQANAGDVEACAAYLRDNEIASALAHPFYDVAAPLTRRHRRRLAELFPTWEVRNGSRAAELNMPAVVYVDTHGSTGIGGSDDHAGVDIGRTFTETPTASTPEEFLRLMRRGDALAGGEQGSAAKWAHAAMALATRALALDGQTEGGGAPNPAVVLKIAQRVVGQGAAREGKIAADLGPDDARALLEAWLASVGLDQRGRELIEYLQSEGFSHAGLYRRARRAHERRLRAAVALGSRAVAGGDAPAAFGGLFDALVPAVPYAPSAAFLGAEKAKLAAREGEVRRVAVIVDGIGSMHGVTHTIEQIREHGVPGFEVEVVGTDPGVDRRLPAAAELNVPFYEGLTLGVPGLPDLVETLAEGRYDLVHATAPGPAGIAAVLLSRITGMPLVGSYHTELGAYAGMRSGDDGLEAIARGGLAAFYGAPSVVLSPSPAADRSLAGLGVDPERVGRWERGVDVSRFDPAKRDQDAFPGELKVLYAGRLTREKGVDLLAESFLRAHRADPRLHLLLAGGGPEEGELRRRLGSRATFLGWLEGDELARAYASSDIFLFCSRTDTYGQVVVEAGASGLPVVAVAEGGPASLIENRHTGMLCQPSPDHIAGVVLQLASSAQLRQSLGTAAVRAARTRSWDRALGQLAAGYTRALDRGIAIGEHPPFGPPEARGASPLPQYDGPIDDPGLYFNRELSWLDFNQRVLELAEDPNTPLLERVRFCSIYASNLDEFFMVRVAGLFDQLDAGIDARGPDGLATSTQLDAIQARVLELDGRLHSCFNGELRPELEEHGVRIVSLGSATEAERREIDIRFHEQVFPALTPLVIGLGRPFPYISNLSLSLGVLLRDPDSETEIIARVKVPKELLGRFLRIGEEGSVLVPLEEAIAANLDALFPGTEVIDHGYFRVTRDADFNVSDEADDLLQAVQDELRRRRFGEVVRLEIATGMNSKLRGQLIDALRLEDREVYDVDGLIDLADLTDVVDVPGHAELRYRPWTPVTQPRLQGEDDEPADIFAAIRQGDILVHHPYDSFATSVERFVEQAVVDPDVLAIKQTVYRTSDDSALVPSLIRASERGKQAVCMVELKARFDEAANIHWAKSLEESGVHVVYGIPGLKTHVKAIVVARREGDRVREYVHIGTGNYNPKTARLYTDLGLFTADPEIGADVAEMFNFLTGYGRPAEYRKVLVAPTTMRDRIIEEIEATVHAHRSGQEARIALKMNALADARCIQALYEASQAGVRVDLNVRGICCLRPGIPGVSENIRVVSVVGRFLEHSRLYAFQRGEETRVLMGSADLMPRNLDSRVELVTPVEDEGLKGELADLLERSFADNANAWELGADGTWARLSTPEGERRSVQDELRERHAIRAGEQLAAAPG